MELPKRRKMRLEGYNYSQNGAYFITICTHKKLMLFANVGNGLDHSAIALNECGLVAKNEIENISTHFAGVHVDKSVVMPNHVHAIIVIGCDGVAERSRPFPTLSTVVGLYKSGVSKRIHEIDPDIEIWQTSFHDHIIRNEREYREIWQYIDTNPMKWEQDCFCAK